MTSSPSMDILISSNLERLLYSVAKDADEVVQFMKDLQERGRYQISMDMERKLAALFYSGSAKDGEGSVSTFQTYKETGYILDPHTAVAKFVADQYNYKHGKDRKTLIVSTASPFKFSQTVLRSLKEAVPEEVSSAISAVAALWKKEIPASVLEVIDGEERHNTVCAVEDMKLTVSHFLLS